MTLKPPTYYPPKTARTLLGMVYILLRGRNQLAKPLMARSARYTLGTVRKWGYQFQDPAHECDDCLACLHLSLMYAALAMEKRESLSLTGVTTSL
jgi:hypothetical protein